jgi:hypothetical protein
MRGVQNPHLKIPNQTADKTPKLCNPMSKSSMNQTQRSDGILDPGIIYSPAPPPRTHKRKKNPYHQRKLSADAGYEALQKQRKKGAIKLVHQHTTTSLACWCPDYAIIYKKKPHLVSPEPPNLNLCLSRSPLLSPGNFRK